MEGELLNDTSYTTIILGVLPTLATLGTLATFLSGRKKAAIAQGVSQANAENALTELAKSITSLSKTVEEQQRSVNALHLTVSLILQQHRQNHGQQLEGGNL